VPLGMFTSVSDVSRSSAVHPHGPVFTLSWVRQIFLKTAVPEVPSHSDYKPGMYCATEHYVRYKRKNPCIQTTHIVAHARTSSTPYAPSK
jgi:hypothetical protein